MPPEIVFIPGSGWGVINKIQYCIFRAVLALNMMGTWVPYTTKLCEFSETVTAFAQQKNVSNPNPIVHITTEILVVSQRGFLETVLPTFVKTIDTSREQILIGFSVGGLYATYLALVCNVEAIVLDSPLWVLPTLCDLRTTSTARIVNIYYKHSPFSGDATPSLTTSTVYAGVDISSMPCVAAIVSFLSRHIPTVYAVLVYSIHFSHLFHPLWAQELRKHMLATMDR
jgi:hypothetical protein